ncbi:regulating synaptic membrane exocytosis protein 1-like isoform X2 [Paramormyrops kingsleyae]|uniref:regulating synaptic membrane exocytosis protein 1-like isoform X2 n=1 Tax=Paramormyrops kingsleyae TaxID=1676925 RepID=UPI000CD64786|nr:regulating synaptic membrane exocytosis protein 1-like isoform X2 [Paramormyrops kingsleyae]
MSASVGSRTGSNAPTVLPSSPDIPDLSHLTEEERNIIMAVILRQKNEEAMVKREAHIDARSVSLLGKKRPEQDDSGRPQRPVSSSEEPPEHMGGGVEQRGEHQAPTCSICCKTKFAEGCGHTCSYCRTRFCARCGGRVSLCPDNVIWVCNLCRKQPEILTGSARRAPGQGSDPSLADVAKSDPGMCGDKQELHNPRNRLSEIDAGPDPARMDPPGCRSRSEPPRGRRLAESAPEQSEKARLPRERPRKQLQKGHSHDLSHRDGEKRPSREDVQLEPRYRSSPHLETCQLEEEAKAPIGRQERRRCHATNHKSGPAEEAELGDAPDGRRGGERERTVANPVVSAQNHVDPVSLHLREPPDWSRRQQGCPELTEVQDHRPHGAPHGRAANVSNDSPGINQSESPPVLRPCRVKRGVSKRHMSPSSSEEEEYANCDEAAMSRTPERGAWKSCHQDTALWQHPTSWQPSKEGDRLIGRIALSRGTALSAGAGGQLGLKVVGGKVTEAGELGAFITKVKKGSLADLVGHLRAGDKVLQWNGKSLVGATKKDVYNIILESIMDPQVEIVVSRPVRLYKTYQDVPRIQGMSPPVEARSGSYDFPKMEPPSPPPRSPSSGTLRDKPQLLPGQLSVKLWYDNVGHQLIVNVLQATELPARPDGRPRNPYVKMYFLPDRSDKSKRRSKTVRKTLAPRWNQTFLYGQVQRRDLRERTLELSMWDQPHAREEESHFLGEVLIELETALLDDKPHWYQLQARDASSGPTPLPRKYHRGNGSNGKLRECGSRERERSGNLLSPEPQPMAPQWDEQDEPPQPAPGVILHRAVAHPPSTVTPTATRRVRQLPQVPVKGSSVEEGNPLVEERTRQVQLKVQSYRTSTTCNTTHDLQREPKGKRERYRGRRRSSDSFSDSDISDISAVSRDSSASRVSNASYMSVQSERPRGRVSHPPAGSLLKSSSMSGEMYPSERADGSQSDPAPGKPSKQRRTSLSSRVVAAVGRPTRRSRSTTLLSQAEANKKSKGPIQRSQETGMAVEYPRSAESADGSMNSCSSEGNLLFSGAQLGADGQFSDFLDGLGPAQLVGRQTLATPAMGDVQIGLMGKRGQLEVEVIRARGLTPKPGSKSLPAPYVKVYLLESGVCKAKKKTKIARKTLDPLYQQVLLFEEPPQSKVLQVIVWGDYGRMDHKCFMGVAQILLEELDLSSTVISWYKLFPASSLVDPTLAPLTRRASQTSLDILPGPLGARS